MGQDEGQIPEKLDPASVDYAGFNHQQKGEAVECLPFLLANCQKNPKSPRVYEPLREGGK